MLARNEDRLSATADELRATGACVEIECLDVLSEEDVNEHAERFARKYGAATAVLHAVSFPHVQGVELEQLSLADFMLPVQDFICSLFIVSRATARLLSPGGVIVSFSTPIAKITAPGHLGYAVACAGIEAFSRNLAMELGPRRARAVCIRPHAIAHAVEQGSYTDQLFAPKAEAMGLSVAEWLAGAAQSPFVGSLPTLDQVADAVLFAASPAAATMTGTVLNLSAGAVTD